MLLVNVHQLEVIFADTILLGALEDEIYDIGGVLGHGLHGGAPVACREHLVAVGAERDRERAQQAGVVVDDEVVGGVVVEGGAVVLDGVASVA